MQSKRRQESEVRSQKKPSRRHGCFGFLTPLLASNSWLLTPDFWLLSSDFWRLHTDRQLFRQPCEVLDPGSGLLVLLRALALAENFRVDGLAQLVTNVLRLPQTHLEWQRPHETYDTFQRFERAQIGWAFEQPGGDSLDASTQREFQRCGIQRHMINPGLLQQGLDFL